MTDNNNADMDDATIEGRVELRTGAAGACQESKDALKQAMETGTENEIATFQTACDTNCGETCTVEVTTTVVTTTVTTTDNNANTNFISAILFVLIQFFM